uniref:Uncharacterized protein n=1 Tax=Avena sativa TaxID=4498 RepID=A0ACD5UKS2_AVESA
MPLAGATATSSILLLLLLRAPFAEGQSSEATSEAFVMEQVLSESECGAFAGLVAATAAAGDAFRAQIAGDNGGDGLTIFCPVNGAVAEFGLGRFGNLTADGQAALLLYHGVATLYSEAALGAMFGTNLATLANGPGGGGGDYDIRVYGTDMPLLLSSSANAAVVTKMVVDKDRLAVYLVDTVLVPGERTPFRLDWGLVTLVLFGILVGLLALVLLLFGLVNLVRWLKRSCQDRAAARVSAARVTPDG